MPNRSELPKMLNLFSSSRSARIDVLLIALLASLLALACGSSGGGSSGGAGTGSTSVFLTDAASDRFDEILVTISSLELLGNGAPVVLFSGRETVDLKDLESFSDLFVYAEEVPAGTYNKIRMRVTKVELVDGDDVTEIDPPARGKIDLVPRGPFDVKDGINLVIEIDMDAKKSIQISNGYRFRPVIFVTISETRSPDKLARVHGEITELLADGDFELCSTIFMAARARSSGDGIEAGGLGDRHRCMVVELDGDTGVFDSNGDATNASALSVGDEVTLVGRFHMIDDNHDHLVAERRATASEASQTSERSRDNPSTGHREHDQFFRDELLPPPNRNRGGNPDRDSDTDADRDTDSHSDRDSDSDSDDGSRPPNLDIIFLAFVVEVGPAGTFLHLNGVIETALDDAGEFDFAIAPRQGFGDASIVTALLQDGTRIFGKQGDEIGGGEIIPDTGAKIDGVFVTDAIGSFYKTALLILDLEVGLANQLRGEILQANETTGRLVLAVDGGDECVDVPEESGIFLIRDDGSGATSEEGNFEDLVPGLRSDVYGSFAENEGCFVAETILAFPIDCLDNVGCPIGQYCAKEAGTCAEPGICTAMQQSACVQIYEPVCSCDGVTYSNACEARASGASVANSEACTE